MHLGEYSSALQASFPNLLCLVTAPNDGVKVTCEEKFYFKIDEVFDVGGTVSILAANSSYSICLNQAPDESCPEEVTLESGKEGILTETGKRVSMSFLVSLLSGRKMVSSKLNWAGENKSSL